MRVLIGGYRPRPDADGDERQATRARATAQQAYVIAAATQYVDDTPITQPTRSSGMFDSLLYVLFQNDEQQRILRSYHFTQADTDDKTTDVSTRYLDPSNAQLTRLSDAADKAKTEGGNCANWVMFGEYLHALEDTFGHRDASNKPVPIRMGFGHALEGHNPDYTYSEDPDYTGDDPVVRARIWAERPLRTAAMEETVFKAMSAVADGKAPARSWDEIEPIVEVFNAIAQNSETGLDKKLKLLQEELTKFGYTTFVDSAGKESELDFFKSGQGKYEDSVGKKNRDCALRYKEDGDGHKAGDYFKEGDFPGTILGSGSSCG